MSRNRYFIIFFSLCLMSLILGRGDVAQQGLVSNQKMDLLKIKKSMSIVIKEARRSPASTPASVK
jgi:hypothetical protein